MSERGSGDFAIGSKLWPGAGKLLEEMGEVAQVLGKLIAVAGDATRYWSGDLRAKLIEELGDLSAAVRFFATQNFSVDELRAIQKRSDEKLQLFGQWHGEKKP